MTPIAPARTVSMQTQISRQIADTVTELPIAISDLISQYADENADADRPLAFDKNQEIIDDEDNRRIRAAMKRVLTSDTDPARKLLIFQNVQSVLHQQSDIGYPTLYSRIAYIRYVEAMNRLFDEIRAEGGQVNLDSVIFRDFHLSGYYLNGASMKGAKFVNTSLNDMFFTGADFSDACFEGGLGQDCDFSGANLTRSVWRNSCLFNSTLTRVDLSAALLYRAEFNLVFADGLSSDDEQLNALIGTGVVSDDGTAMAERLGLQQDQRDRFKERLADHLARETLTSAHVLQATYTTPVLETVDCTGSNFQPGKYPATVTK